MSTATLPQVSHIARRRRSTSTVDPLRKMTLQMHESVAGMVKRIVDDGDAPSINAFIEAAVVDKLRSLRQEKVYASYVAAAADPVFMEDMRTVSAAFETTAADGL
jgi:hypothetical protein